MRIHSSAAMICILSVVLSLLTGVILLIFTRRGQRSNLFLSGSFLAFGLGFTLVALILTRAIWYVPHLYRTGNIFMLLYMPLSFLFVSSSLRGYRSSPLQLLHLLPVLLYIIDYLPFFLSSADHKRLILTSELMNLDQLVSYKQGWLLPDNFHIPFRTLQMAGYWIFQIRLLILSDDCPIRKDRSWMQWQYIYNGLQLLIFFPALLALAFGGSFVWVTSVAPAAGGLISALTLFLYPRILYNMKEATPVSSAGKPVFSTAFILQLNVKLEDLMRQHKPYLNANYSLSELAAEMDLQPYKLSAFINQVAGKNFSDFLNEWRIRHCLELMREKDTAQLNLHGIALKCGFNNRNTFASAFKKFIGESPSVYLHSRSSGPLPKRESNT